MLPSTSTWIILYSHGIQVAFPDSRCLYKDLHEVSFMLSSPTKTYMKSRILYLISQGIPDALLRTLYSPIGIHDALHLLSRGILYYSVLYILSIILMMNKRLLL